MGASVFAPSVKEMGVSSGLLRRGYQEKAGVSCLLTDINRNDGVFEIEAGFVDWLGKRSRREGAVADVRETARAMARVR